jgi:hypothetical protein
MHLRYDEDFVETAINLCVTGSRPVPSLQIGRFLCEREKLYKILDPDDRNAAFFKLHLAWFREWGLEKLLTGLLKEFPLLPVSLELLAFRQARGKHDEGAELYVNESGARNGVIALRPERLKNDGGITALLRHELTHLHDMVNPEFGYQPHLQMTVSSLGQPRLIIERYRVLWDITIDGRLARAGRSTIASRDQRLAEFTRAFPFWSQMQLSAAFDLLWTTSAPTHHTLAQLVSDPRGLRSATAPIPGAPCPLCGFPTFDWAVTNNLPAAVLAIVSVEFPSWSATKGLCNRCLEAYQVAVSLRQEEDRLASQSFT